MTSGIGLFDALFAALLTNGAMLFAAVLLVLSIVILVINRGKRRTVKIAFTVVLVLCLLYLLAVAALVFLFNSAPPAPPTPTV